MPNMTASEIKRSQSVNEKIRNYRQQKLMIKEALLNVDSKVNNKIKFNDNDTSSRGTGNKETENNENGKKVLFGSDEESGDEYNFDVKQAFTGKEGKKLFELQSRYKNDKRFVLDERFIDEEEDNDDQIENSEVTETEENVEDEKKKQFEILEQVLGGKAKLRKFNNEQEKSSSKRAMLRFDPTQSDHLKYEIKNTENTTKKKRKREVPEKGADSTENENEEIKQPNVSKEVFYKVSDNLKDTFQKEQTFSLLNSFGNSEVIEEREEEEEQPNETTKKIKFSADINPFKYDSSDDENEELVDTEDKEDAINGTSKERKPAKFWTEPFFFREDDYRFQEGVDFIQRIASEKKNDTFVQLRRDLKNIVRAKVKNNQRKNRPFKKKLGGNKQKKMIRMKKALKR